ncbi:MAG: sigma-70 family RNA polymerase sigma factor [Clostridiaceae bacterium]|nr:sigma-70 family RNA polymerase sigma factor [Clostridiaceae bacterium]
MTDIEAIYERYFKDVYLYIYALSQDKHIAEDITSEAFIKALDAIDSFRGSSDIRVWLCQIAKNCYYSYLRKNRRTISLESVGDIIDSYDPDTLIMTAEDSMKLHQCLHQLKEPYKEVFSLRVFGELSFKQIASLFNKTDNWACVTFHRAKMKIQEEMRRTP